MIRVAFRPLGDGRWIGGQNYLWNLLFAVLADPGRRIQPVLQTRAGADLGDLRALPGLEIVTGGVLDSFLARRAGSLGRRILGRDPTQEAVLRRHRIDVFSHAPPFGPRWKIPWVYWIPDLQHRSFPSLFTAEDCVQRDADYRTAVRNARVVLLSSEVAKRDLLAFAGEAAARKARVVRFVAQPRLPPSGPIPLADLQARWSIPARFFHLPNQFWKHKNHLQVVEALSLVAARAPDLVMVATGAAQDHREPAFPATVLDRVRELGLESRFRHLGVVPFADLVSLMVHSVAIVNPSRFEGWSTTVEEAKSLGKHLVLSDIPVHREQAPPRARWFPLDDARALADVLVDAWTHWDPAAERTAMEDARVELPGRTRAFAQEYSSVIEEVARG